jgi:hypothetical protein
MHFCVSFEIFFKPLTLFIMKWKLVLSLVLITAGFQGFSQYSSSSGVQGYPIVLNGNSINYLTVSNDIDVVLEQVNADNVGVRTRKENLNKLQATVIDGSLYLSAKNLTDGERLTVYVNVDELKSIALSGNAFATSRGVIKAGSLRVRLDEFSKAMIRTTGKLRVTSPKHYEVVQGENYYALQTAGN